MNHLIKTILVLSLSSTSGCFSNQAGQVGEEVDVVSCTVKSAELVQSDFVTDEGYTVEEALTALTEDVTGTMKWVDGSETEASLTFDVELDAIEYLRKDIESSSDTTLAPVSCDNQISIPVVMSLSTVDQRLNEQYQATLFATTKDWGDIDIKPESYTGSLNLMDFESETDGTLASRIEVRFRSEEKVVQVRGSFASESNGVASIRLFEIGELRLPTTL